MTTKKDSDPIVQNIFPIVQKISSFVAPSVLFFSAVFLIPFSFSRTAQAIPKDPPASVSLQSPSFRKDLWTKIQQFLDKKTSSNEEKPISVPSSSQSLEPQEQIALEPQEQIERSVLKTVTESKEREKKTRSFFFLDWNFDFWFALKTVYNGGVIYLIKHLNSKISLKNALLDQKNALLDQKDATIGEKDGQVAALTSELQNEKRHRELLQLESFRNLARQGQQNLRSREPENRREP
jgi:hypothetical protein